MIICKIIEKGVLGLRAPFSEMKVNMKKTEDSKRIFQNGKELLDKCIYKLTENQKGEAGGNVAMYPVVVIMMGEKCKEYTRYIKNTLDDNWNNARFLQYLNVVKKENGYICHKLKETGNDEIWQWNNDENNFEEQLDEAIVEMLEADEKIFQDRNTIKLEYVLDATETSGKDYIDLFRRINSHLHANELKTLYLMIDQRPKSNKADDSDRLVRYIVENKDAETGTVYLLSNYLKSGRMLGEKYIFENYRLIANVILLGGNKGGNVSFKQNLYNGIKTVSYALVTKPTDEIAAVALQTLLAHIYEEEKSNLSQEMAEQEIRERLKLDRYNGIELAEKIFKEKIECKFPSAECFEYLPFCSVKEWKECIKDDSVSIRDLERFTFGAASSFIKMHYEEPVEKLFENEESIIECQKRIRLELIRNFEFFELLALDDKRTLLKSLIEAEYHSGGSGVREGFTSKLHNLAIYNSKKSFYEKMKQLYVEVMYELLDSVMKVNSIYAECEKEIQKECIVTGNESDSVEKIYTSLVREFVRSEKKINEHKSAFPDIFNSDNTKEELLQAFWNTFCSLTKMKEFSYDFEKEVDFRMDSMSETQRYMFVSEELQKKLEGSIRLRNAIDVATMKMSCYYLINESADYANNLKQADGNGKEYTLFDLNRTDCIEQLEIYNITKPELLHLTHGGMKDED